MLSHPRRAALKYLARDRGLGAFGAAPKDVFDGELEQRLELWSGALLLNWDGRLAWRV
jgi:hypothetical protein